MGRASLILVILMSTLFAGIAMRMNRRMLDLPEMLTDLQLKRAAENLSDYSLRYAIDTGKNEINGWFDRGFKDVHVRFRGVAYTEKVADNGATLVIDTQAFPVLAGKIRQISFKNIHVSATNPSQISFQAVSTVEGILQGRAFDYVAEVAFNATNARNPNCFYHEMENNFNGNSPHKQVQDSTPWGNDGYDLLHVKSKKNAGVNNSTAAILKRSNKVKWENVIYTPNSTGNTSMQVDAAFTLVGFVKIDSEMQNTAGAMVWLPTLPSKVPAEDDPYSDPPPTAGIWLGEDNLLHYLVGGNNGDAENPAYGTVEATLHLPEGPYSPQTGTGNSPNYGGNWSFFALTFENGTVTGYYIWVDDKGVVQGWNSAVSATTGEGDFKSALTSEDGASVGGRITQLVYDPNANNPYSASQYDMIFIGAMDAVGMYDEALSAKDLMAFYYNTMKPSSIDYIREGWGIGRDLTVNN